MLDKTKLCFTISAETFNKIGRTNAIDEIGGTKTILKNGIFPEFDDNCSGKENSIACITAYTNNTEMNTWAYYDDCLGATYYRIEFEGEFDKIYLDNEGFEYCLPMIRECETAEEEELISDEIAKINPDFTQIKMQDIFNHNLLTEEQFNSNQIDGIVYCGSILPEQITRIDIMINRGRDETHESLPNPQILETLYCK